MRSTDGNRKELVSFATHVLRDEYGHDKEFRKAAVASVLSAIRDIKHSCTDENLARKIADRIFGYDPADEGGSGI